MASIITTTTGTIIAMMISWFVLLPSSNGFELSSTESGISVSFPSRIRISLAI
jgi:hypothetical protein